MFPKRGKNYKKIEKHAGVQEDPANEELQRRIECFPVQARCLYSIS